jgi:hypothetical protein
MVLLLQLGAVLVAGWVAAAAWSSKATPAAVARAIVILAFAFGYIAFWGHIWPIGKSFLTQRSEWEKLAPAQAAVAGSPLGVGSGTDFAEWIRARIKPGERFYLVPSPSQNVSVYQWFTYRLLPNLESERPQRADWLIFYGTYPRASGYLHLVSGIAEQFGPGLSIARVRHAS